ncbi:MAG: M20/M25/M40 family metallo-hydrolase [Actinomycetota bacterium]|nr:M20/M25/M40 family metallo-hydrolase [Actinomycetota bacterium]MCL6093659.1 M20/M25/M40 family metallo-hydrolase [Actinomycetota bacterium]MDA8167161.1 M20/M25/M40 family metallo-hydrolase [Actinomycetota bacterium]
MNFHGAESDDPLISLFTELVRIPSSSGHEREVMDFLTTRLRGLGLAVEESDPIEDHPEAAGNLYCRLPATKSGTPVMLSAHVDTVASEEGALPHPVVEEGVIRSGSRAVLGADDKAAVAAIVRVVEEIVHGSIDHGGIELLLTVGEESGLRGAKASSLEGFSARCGFCFDSTGPVGGLVVRSPSQKTIRATFIGRSAHAGVAPEQGRSAIKAAARAVAEMPLGRIDAETTANIGIIKGGEAVNVVAGRCQIAGEARSHDDARLEEQVTAMLDAISFAATVTEVDVEVSTIDEFHGFDIGGGNPAYDLAWRALEDAGIKPHAASTGGGSDVNVFILKGMSCVNLASGMENVHTSDEYILVESLRQLRRVILAIVARAAS